MEPIPQLYYVSQVTPVDIKIIGVPSEGEIAEPTGPMALIYTVDAMVENY